MRTAILPPCIAQAQCFGMVRPFTTTGRATTPSAEPNSSPVSNSASGFPPIRPARPGLPEFLPAATSGDRLAHQTNCESAPI